MRRTWLPLPAACALLGACATHPYQPLRTKLPALPADAWSRVLDATRASYPSLTVVDPEAFRLQSSWVPIEDPERAGEKRATVFVEGDHLNVVVEKRYLGIDLLGNPSWSSARSDPERERELTEALLAALGK
jgi:hypothetical protein